MFSNVANIMYGLRCGFKKILFSAFYVLTNESLGQLNFVQLF